MTLPGLSADETILAELHWKFCKKKALTSRKGSKRCKRYRELSQALTDVSCTPRPPGTEINRPFSLFLARASPTPGGASNSTTCPTHSTVSALICEETVPRKNRQIRQPIRKASVGRTMWQLSYPRSK